MENMNKNYYLQEKSTNDMFAYSETLTEFMENSKEYLLDHSIDCLQNNSDNEQQVLLWIEVIQNIRKLNINSSLSDLYYLIENNNLDHTIKIVKTFEI